MQGGRYPASEQSKCSPSEQAWTRMAGVTNWVVREMQNEPGEAPIRTGLGQKEIERLGGYTHGACCHVGD